MKAAPERDFDIEDRLSLLRHTFEKFAYDGVYLEPAAVQQLLGDLEAIRAQAISMRLEMSRRRWNARARCDELFGVLVSETARADSNVTLFPVAGRAIPSNAVQLVDADADAEEGDEPGGAA